MSISPDSFCMSPDINVSSALGAQALLESVVHYDKFRAQNAEKS